ncbi:MAG: LysM peptidoglycan-binding domain-containing protein, partial [Oligoflexia bacterium]|nr:LysM peptidoglycan-binding domain-containing protein [Oligoflexia bacterium]
IFESESFGEDEDDSIGSIYFFSSVHNKTQEIKVNKKLKEKVEYWVRYFTGPFKTTFKEYLERGGQYRNLITKILKEHQLPEELYYLPIIESGYLTHATSSASAVGPWQFISSTGKSYGLEINNYIDERRDIAKSTQAAAAYLRDLYNIFGSWELALAAYNAGPYRIMGTIIKGSNRDFWKLSEQGIFPKETSNYIPKFIAAVIIGENVGEYDIKVKQPLPTELYEEAYVAVKVPSDKYIDDIAKILDIENSTLKAINPELKTAYIPNIEEEYDLNIPSQKLSYYQEKNNELIKLPSRLKNKKLYSRNGKSTKQKTSSAEDIYYVTKKGDSVESVARKFNIPVYSIVQSNGLSDMSKIPVGKKLKITPVFSGIYTVKSGDNIGYIAKLFNTTPNYLKKINGLSSNRIYLGQRLRVSPASFNFYIVKEGDNLFDIARSNGLSTKNLIRINSLDSTRIFKGQKLIVVD